MNKKNMMVRSVKIRNPINKGKLNNIKKFLVTYNGCVNYFIKRLWSEKTFSGRFLDKNYMENAKKHFPELTMRLIQCAGKEALQNIKSQRKKSKRQQTMPRFKKLIANLDSRFWEISTENNSFEWLHFQSGYSFNIPFKRNTLWCRWEEKGFRLSKSIRLKTEKNALYIEFFFEKEKPKLRTDGRVVGGDLGYVNLSTLSDGQQVGINMNKYIERFDKREKNTHIQAKQKAFEELKKIGFSNIKVLIIEELRNVKKGKRGMFPRTFNRRLSHWLYAKTIKWLEQHCEEQGIGIRYVSPYKTSQYCRFCGKWDKRNRKGEKFVCMHCGHTEHADINASKNLELLGLAGAYSLRSLPSNFIGGM